MDTDKVYINEILQAAAAAKPTTREEFDKLCRKDINAGYGREVDEAWRRYTDPRRLEERGWFNE